MKKYRFKLGPNDPYFRYVEDGIMYTANAIEFNKIELVEKAFDDGLFVPLIDYKTNRPTFTKKDLPVYYLPYDALESGVDVVYIKIDNSEFNDKVILNENLGVSKGRIYRDCIFYDCQIVKEHHKFMNCRFIRCIINDTKVSDCRDLSKTV